MKKYTFTDLLDNPESRSIIEQIEGLSGTQEETLIRIRKNLINELEKEYGYKY